MAAVLLSCALYNAKQHRSEEDARRVLPARQLAALRSWRNDWKARLNPGDLIGLAAKFGSDKWGSHLYARHYPFTPLLTKKITTPAISIGGYESPTDGVTS